MTHGRDDRKMGTPDESRSVASEEATTDDAELALTDPHELPDPHQDLQSLLSVQPLPQGLWVPWRPSGPAV